MSFILCEVKDNLAMVMLNRPDKFNAFNREMALQLQQVLDECAHNDNIRAISITGSGKAFCAGQDISELVGDEPIGIDKILCEHFNPIIRRIRTLQKPVIAAVNGVAAGAGANIALACDIVIAAESASFIQAFSKIGLIPDSGGTFILPRLIGFQKASAIMMLGDKIGAEDAAQMGMIYKVFSDEVFWVESERIISTLANMPTSALALTKQALNESISNNLEAQLSLEDELQRKAAKSEDYKEGINSFLEKRPAQFTGK
jgi:2-(1,2-epoxy-1,2-dihydrophenyl)acetyl-CoA isomerase